MLIFTFDLWTLRLLSRFSSPERIGTPTNPSAEPIHFLYCFGSVARDAWRCLKRITRRRRVRAAAVAAAARFMAIMWRKGGEGDADLRFKKRPVIVCSFLRPKTIIAQCTAPTAACRSGLARKVIFMLIEYGDDCTTGNVTYLTVSVAIGIQFNLKLISILKC